MNFEYRLKVQVEKLGPFDLEIECLEDMNQTIDEIFQYLEKRGTPQDLEKLCPYFGVVWPSALGLSQYLLRQPKSQFDRRKILELGCGLAIPSMALSKQGAEVTATDTHEDVPRFLQRNLKINNLIPFTEGTLFKYSQVDWEKDNPDLGQFDWVIGSDILYERRYAESLAYAISKRVAPHGKVVIADPGRPYLQAFADLMKSFGFSCEIVIETVWSSTLGIADGTFPKKQDVFVLVLSRGE